MKTVDTQQKPNKCSSPAAFFRRGHELQGEEALLKVIRSQRRLERKPDSRLRDGREQGGEARRWGMR